MRILITGNMGYVGPGLVSRLRSTFPQSTLIGFDMGYFASCLTNVEILPECKLDVQHFGDVRNFPEHLFKGVDTIVQLAAISNDPIGKEFEQATLDVNYKSSISIAQKAKRVGVKNFIFASSCSIYGAAEDNGKTEESTLNPLTAYARSKVFTERDLKALADKNFKVSCLRFATACGMSDRLRLDLVLNDFVACAVASKKITILSDGTPWRPLINVQDMARAIEWAITRDHIAGDFLAVNVGSNNWNYQVKDLAKAVADIVPGTEISINHNALPDKGSYKVSFDLFKSLAPDYQPEYDLNTTILQLKNALEETGFNDENFRNSRRMRLKVLNQLRQLELLDHGLNWTNHPQKKDYASNYLYNKFFNSNILFILVIFKWIILNF